MDDPTLPGCPTCGTPMVRRNRKSDGAPFWGCPRFPQCRGIRPIEPRFEPTQAPQEIHPTPSRSESVAGGSARAEFEKRRDRHRNELRTQKPWVLGFGAIAAIGFLIGTAGSPTDVVGIETRIIGLLVIGLLVLGALVMPSSTRAWRTGAEGEEATARILDKLEPLGFLTIHDVNGQRDLHAGGQLISRSVAT